MPEFETHVDNSQYRHSESSSAHEMRDVLISHCFVARLSSISPLSNYREFLAFWSERSFAAFDPAYLDTPNCCFLNLSDKIGPVIVVEA